MAKKSVAQTEKIEKEESQVETTPAPAEEKKTPAATAEKSKTKKQTTKKAEAEKPAEVAEAPVAVAAKTEPKAEKPAKSEKTGPAPKTMEELMASYQVKTPKKGETMTGKVTEKTRKSLLVDIGGKTEGLVLDKEFEAAREYIDQLEIGDEVEAYVISSENDRGQILLSLKKAAVDTKWDEFTDAMKKDQVVAVKGLEVNKGGLIVAVEGIRGFIPSSQFGKEHMGNIAKLKGRKIDVKVIEVDREKNRLIFSEKHVSEANEIAQRDQALGQVKVGQIYEGVVSGIMHFGLFVTVEVPLDGGTGHVEGLVHISEISWEKVADPHDHHKVGEKLQVKVLGVDEEAGKLNLSIKQLSDDPWTDIAARYPVGTTVTGKVSRVAPFGVFVHVEPGVDGLIHTSKLSPDQFFEPGEELTVIVESVDPAQRRMSLSIVLTEAPMGYK